jgi:hypothetical protein
MPFAAMMVLALVLAEVAIEGKEEGVSMGRQVILSLTMRPEGERLD